MRNKDVSWLQRRLPNPLVIIIVATTRCWALTWALGIRRDNVPIRHRKKPQFAIPALDDARWFLSPSFPESRNAETAIKLVPFKGYTELCSGSPSDGQWSLVRQFARNTPLVQPTVERTCPPLSMRDYFLVNQIKVRKTPGETNYLWWELPGRNGRAPSQHAFARANRGRHQSTGHLVHVTLNGRPTAKSDQAPGRHEH